jgi:hypothetical protein
VNRRSSEDLVRHPRNPRSLLGLHEALVQQKKDADAAWIDHPIPRGVEERGFEGDGEGSRIPDPGSRIPDPGSRIS